MKRIIAWRSRFKNRNKTLLDNQLPSLVTTEQELNSIDVGNVDEDLKDIDADLQGL